MATRCLIGIVDDQTKTCKATYIHYDGYPSYVNEILNIWKKNNVLNINVDAIVNRLGPASSLELSLYPNPDLPHNHKQGTQPGVMHFYNRDRGENIPLNHTYKVTYNAATGNLEINFEDKYTDVEYVYLIEENLEISVSEVYNEK